MSGLLVKSTVVMKENLLEMNSRGISTDYPVILGGAALTRAYVEQDLDDVFDGEVKYARDAFEGLRLMDSLMAAKRGEVTPEASAEAQAKDEERRARHAASRAIAESRREREEVPTSPSAGPTSRPTTASRAARSGSPGVQGHRAGRLRLVDRRAGAVPGPVGLRGARSGHGPDYEELVETEGRPRLRALLSQVQPRGTMQAAVVHGYFPAVSKGDDLIVLDLVTGDERCRFTSRASAATGTCAWPTSGGRRSPARSTSSPSRSSRWAARCPRVAGEMFARNAYREYLELHGLSVQLTEALAEHWHARVRAELGFADEDARDLSGILKLEHRGARYAWGYPACPDVEEQTKVATLLDWGRIGVELSEEFQLTPEQSTSAIIAHHPEAKYFAAR
jgi:5-methyltetrahydrofolate--homocysteine methyltransferase